jgi:hypothetical protein
MAGEDWKRLARYVVNRRVALGYRTRQAFADEIGVTAHTLGVLEKGRRVSPDTLAAVENGLQWEPGSADLVLEGGAPIIVGELAKAPPQAAPQAPPYPDLRDEVERRLWAVTEAPEEERWSYIMQHRAVERERQERERLERELRRLTG